GGELVDALIEGGVLGARSPVHLRSSGGEPRQTVSGKRMLGCSLREWRRIVRSPWALVMAERLST
ncbi:hypothetical protein, partial [Streptomyces sp. NPDC088135]|uniref:hypothetical protein n=1 Tax=Streptomyces sp. NPDC088135 TaxID=3160993 RepID=UPI00341C078C